MDAALKVLVVDDERDVESLFKQRFRRELKNGQLDLRFAFSGEEALNVLDGDAITDYVLVLSDINMPGMSGLDLLRHVKAQYPTLRVVMISAYGNDVNHRKAIEYGADGYLVKPIDFRALKRTYIPA